MKATGIVRSVDILGRIVLPVELRRTMEITEKDSFEIYVDKDRIVLKKYEPSCIFCNSTENVNYYRGRRICNDCKDEIKGGL